MKLFQLSFAKTAKLALCIVLGSIATSSMAAPINTLENPGFEAPSQGPGGYTYYGGQTLNGWTYVGTSGIAANGSAFNVTGAPGNQAGFLQSNNSRISQQFDFSGGLFTLNFLAEFRNNYGGNTINVLLDGQKLLFGGIDAFSPPTGSSFTQYTSDARFLASGQHVLSFVGTSAPDYTTFIDQVTISVPEPGNIALLAIGALGFAGLRRRRPS